LSSQNHNFRQIFQNLHFSMKLHHSSTKSSWTLPTNQNTQKLKKNHPNSWIQNYNFSRKSDSELDHFKAQLSWVLMFWYPWICCEAFPLFSFVYFVVFWVSVFLNSKLLFTFLSIQTFTVKSKLRFMISVELQAKWYFSLWDLMNI